MEDGDPSERDIRGIVRDVRSARVFVETGIATRKICTLIQNGKENLQIWQFEENSTGDSEELEIATPPMNPETALSWVFAELFPGTL